VNDGTRPPADHADARPEDTDQNDVLDAYDDDWVWRRRIRSNPATHRLYRVAVGVVGLVIVLAGLIAVPAPGPGWLIVIVGVCVLGLGVRVGPTAPALGQGRPREMDGLGRVGFVVVQGRGGARHGGPRGLRLVGLPRVARAARSAPGRHQRLGARPARSRLARRCGERLVCRSVAPATGTCSSVG